MAFSTFRGLMAAAQQGAFPPVTPDYFFADVSRIVQPGGNIAQNYFAFIPGASSSQCYFAFTNTSGTLMAGIANTSSSGPTVNLTGATLIATSAGLASNLTAVGDVIDANNFVVGYINNTNNMVVKKVQNSAGTLSVTSTYTSATNLGAPSSAANFSVVVPSTNYALLGGVGATSEAIELINTSTGLLQSSGTGSWATNVSITGVALSSTLAAFLYLDAGNHVNVQTVDISGTVITVNTAVASTFTTLTGTRIGVSKIDATHILITYTKSNSILGSTVVTLGAGGSVTFNLEYTQSVSNLFPSAGPAQLVSLSASEYAVIYGRTDVASGNDLFNGYVVQGLSLNGTAVTYGAISTVVTQPCYSQFLGQNSYTWGLGIGLSSTKLLFAYNASTNATGTFSSGNIVRIVPVEVGSSTPGWSSTWVNNTTASALTLNAVPSGVVSSIPIGNDYLLLGYPGTNAQYTIVNTDYSLNYYDNVSYTTGVSSVGLGLCGLYPVNNSSGAARAFSASIDVSGNLTALVITIGGSGTLSLGTPSAAIDTSVLNGYPVCAQISANNVLVCYTKSTGIFAVVVQTNATTGISVVGTPVNIYSGAFSGSNISLIMLSSTRFLASFTDVGAQGSSVLGTISGTTVTANAANTFAAAAGNPISSCLLTGSNGIITYRAAGEMQAVTFSYSGNILNQSTATAFSSTGANVKNVQSPCGMLVPVDSTHAMAMYYDGNSQVLYANLLASTGYNNFTAGTQYTISSGILTANVNYANIGLASGSKITGSVAAVSTTSSQVIYMNRV